MEGLTAGQRSLLRAAQLIEAAVEAVDAIDDQDKSLADWTWEGDVHAVGWQAVLLLPDGLSISRVEPESGDALAVLRAAEQELRRHPIWEYPEGTSALVVDLCDLITGIPPKDPL